MIYIAILNNLIVNGSARFLNKLYANDVDIGGTATFASLSTTGNATIGGTLGVTGATTQTGKLTVNNVIEQHGDGIELYYSRPHIDFHYENSTADFTSRIIESAQGVLTITPKLSTPNATITTGNITTLNTNTISNNGAIVTRDMEVVDTLKSYKWDISHVANLANDFTVSPTLQLSSGATIRFTAINTSTKVCTFTITDSSSISSDSLGGVTWTQYSKVKFTMNLNDIVNSNCDGYLTVKMNSTAGTMTISGTLDDVTGLNTTTNYNAEGATIMLYEVGAGSQSTTYPVGIRMTAYGNNKRSYIDIYGGTSTSSWNTPHVRIGNVGGLTFNGETLENQWGIYTDMGYFSGAIVSKEGNIGGFLIDQTNIHNNVTSLTDTSHTGIYLGTDGIRNYNTSGSKHVTIKDGTITANSVDLTGAIKATSGFIGQNTTNGFTISNTAIYNPSTKSSLSSDAVDGVYVGKDGIALGKGVFKVTSAGAVTATNITATGGTIGGFKIDTTSIRTNDVAVTSNADNSISLSSADFTRTINGTSRAGLRFAIGDKFGVTGDGAIYASSATISGAITATSGSFTGGILLNGGYLTTNSSRTTYNSTSATGITIDKNGIGGYASANAYFNMTTGGVLTAVGATITGTVNATTGTFGNATNKITLGTGTSGHSSLRYGMTTLADTTNNGFYVGTDGIALGKGAFKVASDGALTATSATIRGQINATSGFIGQNATNGFNITSDAIYNGISTRDATSGTGVYLGTTGINLGGGKFKVTDDGELTSTSGTVGGWSINDHYLGLPDGLTDNLQGWIGQRWWGENHPSRTLMYFSNDIDSLEGSFEVGLYPNTHVHLITNNDEEDYLKNTFIEAGKITMVWDENGEEHSATYSAKSVAAGGVSIENGNVSLIGNVAHLYKNNFTFTSGVNTAVSGATVELLNGYDMTEIFELQPENTLIKVVRSGVYEVTVTWQGDSGLTNTTSVKRFGLFVNDLEKVVALSRVGGWQTVSTTVYVQLNANDELKLYGCNEARAGSFGYAHVYVTPTHLF